MSTLEIPTVNGEQAPNLALAPGGVAVKQACEYVPEGVRKVGVWLGAAVTAVSLAATLGGCKTNNEGGLALDPDKPEPVRCDIGNSKEVPFSPSKKGSRIKVKYKEGRSVEVATRFKVTVSKLNTEGGGRKTVKKYSYLDKEGKWRSMPADPTLFSGVTIVGHGGGRPTVDCKLPPKD